MEGFFVSEQINMYLKCVVKIVITIIIIIIIPVGKLGLSTGVHLKKLHAYKMRHLRAIMNISWKDKITNIEVLKRAGLPSMEDMLIQTNLRCIC